MKWIFSKRVRASTARLRDEEKDTKKRVRNQINTILRGYLKTDARKVKYYAPGTRRTYSVYNKTFVDGASEKNGLRSMSPISPGFFHENRSRQTSYKVRT